MPQMAPINWLILFLFFFMMFYLLMNLMFFNFMKIKSNYFNKLILHKNYNKFI